MGCYMLNYIFLILGLIIVLISLIFLKRESSPSNEYQETKALEERNFLESIDSVESIIEDMNDSLNETIIKMEKKYTVLENDINNINNMLSQSKNHQQEDINDNNRLYNISSSNNKVPNKEKKDFNINDLKARNVIKLNEMGLSPSEIAKKLNLGIGEVQLILNLYKK